MNRRFGATSHRPAAADTLAMFFKASRNEPVRPITLFQEIFCPSIQSLEETCRNSLKTADLI